MKVFVFENGVPSTPITVGQDARLRTVFQGPEWNTRFIPTLLKYLGNCREPCSWINSNLVRAQAQIVAADLQVIWDAVYGDRISWTVHRGDEVFNTVSSPITLTDQQLLIVSQAMSRVHGWLYEFSTAAIRILDSFFRAYPNEYSDMECRRGYCLKVIKDGRILFAKPHRDTPKVCQVTRCQ